MEAAMPESDSGREERARRLAKEQERQAIELAEQRGREAAKLEGRLNDHDKRLDHINGSIDRSARAQETLAAKLTALTTAFEQNVAVTAARAQDAKTAAERQVSTKTFVIGLVGAVTAIGSLLAATGHA